MSADDADSMTTSTGGAGDGLGPDFIAALTAARDKVIANPRDEQAAMELHAFVRDAVERQPGEGPGSTAALPVQQAVQLLDAGQDEQAEVILRRHLASAPNDTDAMREMARIAAACGFFENADRILKRAVEIEPRKAQNWMALGHLTYDRARLTDQPSLAEAAIELLSRGIETNPDQYEIRSFRAALLGQMRDLKRAREELEEIIRRYPLKFGDWMNIAHVYKTLGQFEEGVAAYRMAIGIKPAEGQAWFDLANMKLAPLFPSDAEVMEDALAEGSLDETQELLVRFALVRAYEQHGKPGRAAPHLLKANSLASEQRPHDTAALDARIARSIGTFTRDFFEQRPGWGSSSDAPIFILGMPRSGSTLIEQILSSHSAIEGTEELLVIARMAAGLETSEPPMSLEQRLEGLAPEILQALGDRYVAMANASRTTDRPFFTDKNPGNWTEIGLILAILPNAKIIDVRRNPLDCCFANYTQHFNRGGNFSYGQREVAEYYRSYLRMMRHFDAVAPGAIHRVIYDDLVENFEPEVERLFAYLELDLEPGCLRFFETERPVYTPSSEQVRQPINRSGMGRWKAFEPWLGDLKDALGDELRTWRE